MTDSQPIIFSGMQILINRAWSSDHIVVVEKNKIKAILPKEFIHHHLPARQIKFSRQHYLIPGLIDLHIHGAGGHDVMDGTAEALIGISQSLAAEGVTGFLATTMTAPNKKLEAVLHSVANFMPDKTGAAILGIHLEGPFISKEKMGAQAPEHIELPNAALISDWQNATQGAIKLVTLAPELPGAMALIKSLHTMGVIVSVGHTNATYAETMQAVAAGCTHATHLFNAMRGMHQREPGAAGALLLAKNVHAELIVDGVHLHPGMVELALRMKGHHGIILVTDAMRAKCLGDGVYELGGQTVQVQAGRAQLETGIIAGSTLRMPEAIKNMVQFTQCSLAEAVSMASYNPAHVLGLEDSKGSIENGKDADLVVMDAALDVVMTMRAGEVIFTRGE